MSALGMELLPRHHADAEDPCAGHDHAMVFHSCVCTEILFSGWKTTNELQLFGSCLAIFVASVLYEGFKNVREHVQPACHGDKEPGKGAAARSPRVVLALQTGLHAVQTTLSYLLMLVFMTYNVWLCLAVLLGLTLGYFLFGWRRSSVNDPNEHCQ